MTPEEKAAAEKVTQDKLRDDLVKQELEKSEAAKKHSDKERAEYNLKKKAEEAKALGIDPLSVLGKPIESTDEVPEWYRKEQAKNAQQTALQLADSITDEDERALVKDYLNRRIVPSGDPDSDFRMAFSAVRSLKNKQILEDVNRRGSPRSTASGGSQSGRQEEIFEPTTDEVAMMKMVPSLTKEKILAARKRAAENQR